MSVSCLVCGDDLEVGQSFALGEIFDCNGCGVELEISARDPIALKVFEEEEK